MNFITKVLAASAFAGAAIMATPAMAGEETTAPQTFTPEEVHKLENFADLVICFDNARGTIQQGIQSGQYKPGEESWTAFKKMRSECEQTEGMTYHEAAIFLDALEKKYGKDIETVFDNSKDMFRIEPATPVPHP